MAADEQQHGERAERLRRAEAELRALWERQHAEREELLRELGRARRSAERPLGGGPALLPPAEQLP